MPACSAEKRDSFGVVSLTSPRRHVEWIEGGRLPSGTNTAEKGRMALGCWITASKLDCEGLQGDWTCHRKESSMLVLSRKKNESIIINDDITIVVVEIRGDKVRLGVEAPKEVPVHRNEVYEAIRRNQQKPDSEPVTQQGSDPAV
jgi:carbon storage regulator